jgi:hypothetical protein
VAAVLWPYSTGEQLGPALRERGLAGLAIVPADRAALGMTGPPPDPAGWWQIVPDPGDLGELAALLADAHAVAVLPGDESAVPDAELLAGKLGLHGNDPGTTSWRTGKIAMQNALASAGVPAARTYEAASLAQAAAAAQAVAGAAGWPVVVKPRWSASSVGVSICHTPADVSAAWAATAGQRGALGEITRVVAVQEYLDGQKWTVDTVTVPGTGGPVHVLTSLWRERVIVTGGHVAWDQSWLVPPAVVTDPRSPALRVAAYARRALDAVGVVWGPACTEVMLTGRGPRLVEVMARLAGCYPVGLVELVTGHSQVTATVDAIADPQALAARPPPDAKGGLAVAQAWLLAPHAGVLDGAALQKIRDLPAVMALSPGLVPGAEVDQTTDTPSSPGRVDLCGGPAQVEKDIAAIRTLEHNLYRRRR